MHKKLLDVEWKQYDMSHQEGPRETKLKEAWWEQNLPDVFKVKEPIVPSINTGRENIDWKNIAKLQS